MDYQIWYTAIVLIIMSLGLIREIIKPSLLVFGTLLLLVLGRVISTDEAFNGFSNRGMLTVGFLFVISGALQSSGAFYTIVSRILGNRHTGMVSRYFKLMLPVAGFSAFLNNTPIVASLIPVIKNWSRRNNLAVSKFLIPLSYAAILGGVCTLIGTSTNLVIHGLLLDHGFSGFTFFEITKIGLPVAILGIIFVALVGNRALPEVKDPIVQLGENTREFVVEMKVGPEYPLLNKMISEANLRHLQGLFLFQITRGEETLAPVAPDERIELGDRLFFTGLPETIYELQKTPGLHVIRDSDFNLKDIDSDQLKTYEAVISSTSPLNGLTVRDSNFRNRYDAVILAIHRSGSRINKKVGDIIFRMGDTLFILGKKGFDKKWYNTQDFSLVSSSVDIFSKPRWKSNIALMLLVGMILVAGFNLLPIVLAAACTSVILILMNVISLEDALQSVDWNVLLVIASSFGIARALENSGLAAMIAGGIIDSLHHLGPLGIIAGVFFITSIYTEMITNNAAAAIMFPIALSTANLMQLDPKPFMITLAIGASASFATPIGYQTNMMVYNPGGYKFTDFLKIGAFMNFFVGIIVITLVYLIFFV